MNNKEMEGTATKASCVMAGVLMCDMASTWLLYRLDTEVLK